jgi:hypothetical protein
MEILDTQPSKFGMLKCSRFEALISEPAAERIKKNISPIIGV